jgi:hypothetical protein
MQRRIYFYEVEAVSYERRGNKTISNKADVSQALSYIASLPFQHDSDPTAYMRNGSDKVAVKIIQQTQDFVSGQLSRIRYDALPQVENQGAIENLKLQKGAGLYEASHFVYFFNETPNLLAVELNIHAPRPETFGKYLVEKLKHHRTILLDDISCSPIIRGDVLDEVLSMGSIAELSLSVRRDAISEIEAADKTGKLGNALRAQAEYSPSMSIVGVYMKRENYSRHGGIGAQEKRSLLGIIKRVAPALHKAKVKVEGQTGDKGSLVERNLLSDKFVHIVKAVRNNDGTIDGEDMIGKIQEAVEIFRNGSQADESEQEI